MYLPVKWSDEAEASTVEFEVPHALELPVTKTLRFAAPSVAPQTGAALRLISRGNATNGNLDLAVEVGVASEGDATPPGYTVIASPTVTWATGNNDALLYTTVALTPPPAAESLVFVKLTFDTTSTIAVDTTHLLTLDWE